jgi:hypothetical protein
MNETKICSKCGELKILDDFGIEKRVVDGRSARCKLCEGKKGEEWRKRNRKRVNSLARKRYTANPTKRRAESMKYQADHPEVRKAWVKANPDKIKSYWKKSNTKRTSTAKGKLNKNISCGINKSVIRGSKAGRPWESLVGYTIDQLKAHLEKLFKPGMTWDNYGTVWQIDHKIPVAVFNFGRPDDIDFRICWSLKNLQPLESKENRKKSSKINKPFQPSLEISGAL